MQFRSNAVTGGRWLGQLGINLTCLCRRLCEIFLLLCSIKARLGLSVKLNWQGIAPRMTELDSSV